MWVKVESTNGYPTGLTDPTTELKTHKPYERPRCQLFSSVFPGNTITGEKDVTYNFKGSYMCDHFPVAIRRQAGQSLHTVDAKCKDSYTKWRGEITSLLFPYCCATCIFKRLLEKESILIFQLHGRHTREGIDRSLLNSLIK